jgi:hypothetical protein
MLDSLGGHGFSHSMNTHEPNLRLYLFDRFFDSFFCRLGRVRGHTSRASSVGPRLCSCVAFICPSYVVPFRDSHHFSNVITRSFPRVNIRHASKCDSKTSFSNQILHLANPHDELSAFVCIQVLGSQVFTD